MKAIWRGSLNFGLVTIDIELVSAIKEHAVSFKLLHDKCHTQIHNMRWCNHCNKEVTWDHVVKGLPNSKNKFFIITKEALKQLKPLKSDTIVIDTFIDADKLQPLWFDAHYYGLARKEKDRAFSLFVTALAHSGKVAIGKVIMKEKEHVCAIQPYQDQLLVTTLHYPYEIRPLPKKKAEAHFDKEELKLAEYLIAKMSHKKISPSLFKDTFIEKLKKALTSKKLGRAAIPEQKLPKAMTLLDILQKSVKTTKRKSRA